MSLLIGRDAEMDALAELLGAAADESAALILEGEPGIGKTTLWLDALKRARAQGMRVLSAQGSAAESVLAYAGLADLLAEVDPLLWADLPTPQQHGLASALLSEHGTTGQSVDPRAVAAAFLTVLKRLASEGPVLVAIDDLQWLDGSTAVAVAFAARRLSKGVVWLCTARSDPASASTGWFQLGRPDTVRRIPLRPLTMSELQGVLISQSGTTLARPTLLRVHQLSGGNPYYATELAQEILRYGPGTDLNLPGSLAELTQARISRVAVAALPALLAIASLADPTVRAVAQALDLVPSGLVELLDEAETEGIIVIEGGRIRFTHPLLAHAVQLTATAPQRRALHRRLAEVVAEPELRARHLALADPAGEPETLDALDAAADLARGRGAPAAAAELLDLAIGLGGTAVHRGTLLAQCLFDAGDPQRACEVLEKVVAQLTPGTSRAEALQLLALVRLHTDSFFEAAELGQRALADCPGEVSALKVNILTGLAFAKVNTGATDAALTTIAEAVDIAEGLKVTGPLGRALSMREMLRFMCGEGVEPAVLDRAVDLQSTDTGGSVAFRPIVHRALLLAWTGELAAASAALAQIGARCVAVGEEGEMMFIAFHLVLIDIWRGDLQQASITADAALIRARQLGGDAPLFIALTVSAAVATYQGRVDDARQDLADAVAAAGRSGSVRLMEWPITTQGFLELSLGDHAKALAALEPLLPMLRIAPLSSEIIAATFVPDAAESMINLGRLDDAEPLIEVLERNGTRLDRAWMLAVGARCRAMLSAARGDVVAGVAHAHEALARHDRVEMPFERARTLLTLGRLERRLRHWRPATAALNEALGIFEAVGTPLWSAQVRAELERGTSGRPRSHGLTPTERRVAELAADGMTNQQIAATLFVARKTVEVNLSRIYRKLGIHSRIELFHLMNNSVPGESARDEVTGYTGS